MTFELVVYAIYSKLEAFLPLNRYKFHGLQARKPKRQEIKKTDRDNLKEKMMARYVGLS